MTIAR